MTTYGGLTLSYDALNRLVAVNGTTAWGSGVDVAYSYDALGRRVRRASASSGQSVDYVPFGQQVLEERTTADNTLARQYVWGQYVDELVQQREYIRKPADLAFEDYVPLSNML